MYLSQIAKCICIKLQNVFVSICEMYLSVTEVWLGRDRKRVILFYSICLKLRNVFVSNCEMYLSVTKVWLGSDRKMVILFYGNPHRYNFALCPWYKMSPKNPKKSSRNTKTFTEKSKNITQKSPRNILFYGNPHRYNFALCSPDTQIVLLYNLSVKIQGGFINVLKYVKPRLGEST